MSAAPRHHELLLRRAPAAAAPVPAQPGIAYLFATRDLAPPPPPPAPAHDPLPEMLAEARAAGYAEGLAAGREAAAQEREEHLLQVLQIIAVRLDVAKDAARAVAEDAAAATAEVALAALAAALPSLGAQHAEAEAAAFANRLLPSLADEPAVELRVAAALAMPLAERFARLPHVAVVAEPTLAAGDVRIAWPGGTAERRLSAARNAVAALLSNFELAAKNAALSEG